MKESAARAALRSFLETVPVVQSHTHNRGITEPVGDVFAFLLNCYYASDFKVADEEAFAALAAADSFAAKQAIFLDVWSRTRHTSFARGLARGISACWGIADLAAPGALAQLAEKLKTRCAEDSVRWAQRFRIRASITDQFHNDEVLACLAGSMSHAPQTRFAFCLPDYHGFSSRAGLEPLERYAGCPLETLEAYLAAFRRLLDSCVKAGVVAMKDQSAYDRPLRFDDSCAKDAAAVYEELACGAVLNEAQTRLLDDYLFNRYMELAAEYSLPVQLHTGHLAGLRGDVRQADAIQLTGLLTRHPDTRFDLFHGNWPYMDSMLFLGKNYPNVWMDLCWVQSIDPVFSIEFMKRAVMLASHEKLFAFGGDSFLPEAEIGYLLQAKDNAAIALGDLTEDGWLTLDEAKEIAVCWFYGNANAFFGLGLPPFPA